MTKKEFEDMYNYYRLYLPKEVKEFCEKLLENFDEVNTIIQDNISEEFIENLQKRLDKEENISYYNDGGCSSVG